MTENRIHQALTRLFGKHRVVFWYDAKKELRAEFEALAIDGVKKIEIQNNEFSIKHKLLRESPKQPFLVYKEDKQPDPLLNWLLDVELANTTFRTDQVAIWLSELELPTEFTDVVEQHAAFFDTAKAKVQAEKRKTALKGMLKSDDTFSGVRLKMLAVCGGATQVADARLDVVLEELLAELIKPTPSIFNLIQRCQLDSFLWQQVERFYGYRSTTPSIKDFAIELFKSCYSMGLSSSLSGDAVNLTSDAVVFFKRWKDSRVHGAVFEKLSDSYAELLGIEDDLNKRDSKELLDLDYFRLIDRKVIYELVQRVPERTLSAGEVTLWCRGRRQSHWFAEFRHLYDAVDIASQFFALLDSIQLDMASSNDAVQGYVIHWYRLDQFYRQYVYCLKASSQSTLLSSLSEKIESLYTNRYLLPLSNAWQSHVDAMSDWVVPDVTPQAQFFSRWAKPFTDKEQKICVIVSDALRYEAAEELLSRIRQEDRYEAKISHALSSLPSYTQLGMASLLPSGGEMLSISDNKTGTVNLGEQSTQGTINRDKCLKSVFGERGSALQARTVIDNTFTENRKLFPKACVAYVYHNRIDHTGDKMQSEGEAFEAVEKTFDELIKLIKRLASADVYNILITADHGFIYQNTALEESDFLANNVHGDVLYNDRRFVLGKNLKSDTSLKSFTAGELGLAGEVQAVFPKGIQRLRLSGSGSRFVHGGTSLQEVIVPIISINKKRQSDITFVDVDILRGGTNVITSGQVSVTLYQAEPVTDKVRPRQLRAGIYTEEGALISDIHDVLLDLTSENARERELKLRFVMSQDADAVNNQEVFLKLEESEEGSNQYRKYKSLRYTIRRSFTSDFDF
jgi:uncharacterized protein (TIGR02687 family)